MIEVDADTTRQVHLARMTGQPETCSCDDCRNFVKTRDIAYPDAVRSLLDSLGIPYNRESEIGLAMEIRPNEFIYNGFFHFIGRIA